MKWETVMGLEVHAELSTKSKIFCGCTTAFGSEPNTQVCPVCSGMPGTLPRLNRIAIDYAIKLGLTLGCEITRNCAFDRKNYFYPDLPKSYQISQMYTPICRNGRIDVGGKTIGIREIHIEEDAGKLVHDPRSGNSFVDFNRCGVPLLEIVSQSDFRDSDDVVAYLERLRETLLYLDICNCKMQEGSFRVDLNLSLKKPGGRPGVRTETKNLNSFKAIRRAVEYEHARQIDILERGGKIAQETRRWDDNLGESFVMRSKEDARDYRYFPEPDIPPLHIDDDWVERIRKTLPELAHQKRERYMRDYGLSEFEASVLTRHRKISDLFEDVAARSGEPIEAGRLVSGEIMRLSSTTSTLPEDLRVDAEKLAALIAALMAGRINRDVYKETVAAVFAHDVNPNRYISDNALLMVSDSGTILEAVSTVICDNPNAVADYRAGKAKAFTFLMGQSMKKLRGAGNPDAVKDALEKML